MQTSHSPDIPQRPPLIVELAGLAGAGKTTLLQALSQRDERIHVTNDLELRKCRHLPMVVRHLPYLLSLLAAETRSGGKFTWDDMKAMVYLRAWPRRLTARYPSRAAVVLLNHGPVFKLATLHAFGPPKLKQRPFDRWWAEIFAQWRNALDIVVWLDAPETTLLDRINTREKRHAIKGRSELQSRCYLERYRTSYEHVLARLTAVGGPALHRVDTSKAPIAQTLDDLLAAFDLTDRGDIDRGPFSKEDRPAYDLA